MRPCPTRSSVRTAATGILPGPRAASTATSRSRHAPSRHRPNLRNPPKPARRQRPDSSLANPLVDLGVCYYNLGDSDEAERDFLLALQRDPHPPIALFNLGIVNERRENYVEAVKYFHRAMQSSPPEEMQQPLV